MRATQDGEAATPLPEGWTREPHMPTLFTVTAEDLAATD